MLVTASIVGEACCIWSAAWSRMVGGAGGWDITSELFAPPAENASAAPGNDLLMAATVSYSGSGSTNPDSIFVVLSVSTVPPASFAQCTYSSATLADPQVRHVCLNPKGTLPAGSPEGAFTVQIRVRVRQGLERFSALLIHLDGADFGPRQEGEAQEYVDISSFAYAAVGQKRPGL